MRCVEAMEYVRREARGELGPAEAAALAAHAEGCPGCRAARGDAQSVAEALLPQAGGGPRDPVAWERALFLRLLHEHAGRGQKRPPAVWARLALRLGRDPIKGVRQPWRRWGHGGAAGGSR